MWACEVGVRCGHVRWVCEYLWACEVWACEVGV